MVRGWPRACALGIASALTLGIAPVSLAETTPDPDDIPPQAPPEPYLRGCEGCTHGLALDGSLAGGATRVVHESRWSGFAGIGFTALYNDRWFELGAEGRFETELFGSNFMTLAGLVGGKSEPEPWLRLELLAAVGAEAASSIGSGLFRNSSGGGATQPYLGGKASVAFLLGRSRRFLLGWWLNGGDALGETVVHPLVQTCFLGCDQSQQTYTIGGPSWSTGIRIGGVASLW
jgi:hypothetical protein